MDLVAELDQRVGSWREEALVISAEPNGGPTGPAGDQVKICWALAVGADGGVNPDRFAPSRGIQRGLGRANYSSYINLSSGDAVA